MNALEEAKKRFKHHPDVISISYGLKKRKGEFTGEEGIVFGVRRKDEIVPKSRMLPKLIGETITDVIERKRIDYHAFVTRRRPCPPGYSVGHVRITAGTLGVWVRDKDGTPLMLSCNHVLADSNNALKNDPILQPGAYDDGFSADDTIARLDRFVEINFEGNGGEENSFCSIARMILDLICPVAKRKKKVRGIEQPSPNLVDAAVAKPLTDGWVTNDAPIVGELKGFGTLKLGDSVKDVTRTTGYSEGVVVGVNAFVRVGFGPIGEAVFDDQLEIEAEKGAFSEPGDSGGAILDSENRVCGLLFAGGDNITIANQIGNVVNLLGIVW